MLSTISKRYSWSNNVLQSRHSLAQPQAMYLTCIRCTNLQHLTKITHGLLGVFLPLLSTTNGSWSCLGRGLPNSRPLAIRRCTRDDSKWVSPVEQSNAIADCRQTSYYHYTHWITLTYTNRQTIRLHNIYFS